MLPLMRGAAAEINEEIFRRGELSRGVRAQARRAHQAWKYIRHFDGRTHPNLPNCDDGPSKSYGWTTGGGDRRVDAEQLYDLMFDPNETHNVAADPASAKVVAEMRGRLDMDEGDRRSAAERSG